MQPHRIHAIVFPDFELLDLSGPLTAFDMATAMHGAPYQTSIISAQGGLIESCSGVAVQTRRFTSDEGVDTVLVVGGPLRKAQLGDGETLELIEIMASRSMRVASVCTGAFLLAGTGLLDGRNVTTHWRFAGTLRKQFPRVRVSANRIFLRDGNIWTSAGVTAGIDLALALVEEDMGSDVSKAVARDLVVYHRRPGGQSQFSTILELEPAQGRIRDAMSFARGHLHEPLPVERLAEAACLSPRQFSRLFLSETGETPARAIERIRAETAMPLIEDGRELAFAHQGQ